MFFVSWLAYNYEATTMAGSSCEDISIRGGHDPRNCAWIDEFASNIRRDLEQSPPQDINRTPAQCSTGFEWPNKSSTPVDSLAESSLGNWKLTMTAVLQTVVLVKTLAHPRNEH